MWRIPRLNQQGLRQAQLDEVRRLEEAFRGTTVAGRELYRKILFGIENRLMRPGTKTEEVIAYARRELISFPSLEPEFRHQFVMGCNATIDDPSSITVNFMAISLVFRTRVGLALSRRLPTQTGPQAQLA